MRPYLSDQRNVFYCPAENERCRWEDDSPGPADRAATYQIEQGYHPGERLITNSVYFSYGYNAWGTGVPPPKTSYGLGDVWDRSNAGSVPELRASRVKMSSEMIAVADTNADGKADFLIHPYIENPLVLPGRIHRGGANVLFCDGHVKWLPQRDVVFSSLDRTSDVNAKRRMWNFDNQEHF